MNEIAIFCKDYSPLRSGKTELEGSFALFSLRIVPDDLMSH